MNTFGFTPADAALSVLGLNIAQIIADYIFVRTHVSSAIFCCGFLYGIWQVAQHGNYRPLISFLTIVMVVALVLLPKRAEGTIQSAAEEYGTSVHSTQAIKEEFTSYRHIPVIFSFIAQMADALTMGIVHAIDAFTPSWSRYISAPFGIHHVSLSVKEEIEVGILDPHLRQSFHKFLADQYLPALSMLKHDSPSIDFNMLWPGHSRIMAYYPAAARREWGRLSDRLTLMMDANPRFAPEVRSNLASLTHTAPDMVREALIRSIVRHEIKTITGLQEGPLNFQAAAWVLRTFPFVYGLFNLLLYSAFPLLILGMAVRLKANALMAYMRVFLWVKSWALGAAFSFYASLLAAQMQGPSPSDPSWAWERPYFCVIAAVMLCGVPVITFFCIPLLRK